MVVDDDEKTRELLRRLLARRPELALVAEGADGEEAIDLARRHRPDVMILDLSMPRLSGFDALPRVREVSPGTRVVVFSGSDPVISAPRALALGAAAFVEKGAHPSHLLAWLEAPAERER